MMTKRAYPYAASCLALFFCWGAFQPVALAGQAPGGDAAMTLRDRRTGEAPEPNGSGRTAGGDHRGQSESSQFAPGRSPAAPAPARGGNESSVTLGVTLAMHEGRPHHGDRHSLHHGMGRGGKGLCPQTRTVPQAPKEYLDKANPLQPTPENLTAGESLFQAQAQPTACKICHGAAGNGMGMMAQGLAAIPRNFNCAETMKEVPDGQMFWIIKNGSMATGMPSYKFLDDRQIWELVLYLRGLTNAQ